MSGTNVETKACCADPDAVAEKLPGAGAVYVARLDQIDTYFQVDELRLKLREYTDTFPDGRTASGAELIRYERADETGARVSEYVRTRVDDSSACRRELGERHGVRAVVRKRRDLWLYRSTRIHLDRVEGLGDFVELETMVDGEVGDAARSEHDHVLEIVGIGPGDTIAGSYADLGDGR